jgi:uncharacterized protein with ParB-like and HNH nuclease domain
MSSVKIKDFFNGRFFEIPKYQRGYAWEVNNIRELFDDVIESIASNSNHYIGTIVLSKASGDDEKFYVVDGQQRITTITLMISALIKQLNQQDVAFYQRFYLNEDGRDRLTPLNRDRQYFIDLIRGETVEPQNKSQRFLTEGYNEIQLKINQIPDKLRFLKSVEKLEVMQFIENSEGDAIRIFQTVNDRGKPLSNMEKAKSLLIYFSNRYLNKELDNDINDCFSDIFEIYDDIKHLAEQLNVNLIRNREFTEDNLMRYHFVTYSDQNYDPSAEYVLKYLKNHLTILRNNANGQAYEPIREFINSYTASLKRFFEGCKGVLTKATEKENYYKLFVILNLSATLYPLIIKLEMLGIIDEKVPSDQTEALTFFDFVELIDVRIYKTRATDPKADVARFVFEINDRTREEIEGWLHWFNQRWMSKEEFQSSLHGNIHGNRALNYIFIVHDESLLNKQYSLSELQNIVGKTPNIEHILSQTPKFTPRSLAFKNNQDFVDHQDCLGNLTVLERSLNSSVQNRSAIEKVDFYDRSIFQSTKKVASDITTTKKFTKEELLNRTEELASFCVNRWWC